MMDDVSAGSGLSSSRVFSLKEVKRMVALVIKGIPVAVAANEIGMCGSHALKIIKGKTSWEIPEEVLKRARANIKKRGRPNEAALNRKLDSMTAKEIREKWITGEYGVVRLAKMYGVGHSTISDIVHCRTYLKGVDVELVEACKKVDRKGAPVKANKQVVARVKEMLANGEKIVTCVEHFNLSRETIKRIKKGEYDER